MQRFLASIGYADRFPSAATNSLPVETAYERYIVPLMNADATQTSKSALFERRALHFVFLARYYMLHAFLVQHLRVLARRSPSCMKQHLGPDYKLDTLFNELLLVQKELERAVRLRDVKHIGRHHASVAASHSKLSGEASRVLDAFAPNELQTVLDNAVSQLGPMSREDYDLEMKTRAAHIAVLYLRSMVDGKDVSKVQQIERLFIQLKTHLRKFRRGSLIETERADIVRTNRTVVREVRYYHQAPITCIPLG